MKNLENKLIEIFCHIDDFNKVFINQLQTYQLAKTITLTTSRRFKLKNTGSDSQICCYGLLTTILRLNHKLCLMFFRWIPLPQRNSKTFTIA